MYLASDGAILHRDVVKMMIDEFLKQCPIIPPACNNWTHLFCLDCLHEWQDFWAGLLGFIAAIFVVFVTLGSERRKNEKELNGLRKALGVEVRQFAGYSYSGIQRLIKLWDRAKESKEKFTSNEIRIADIENITQFPPSNIFMGNTNRVGMLEKMPGIIKFYGWIDVFRSDMGRFKQEYEIEKNLGRFDVSMEQIQSLVGPLLLIALTAAPLIDYLKTGTTFDENDINYPSRVAEIKRELVTRVPSLEKWLKNFSVEDAGNIQNLCEQLASQLCKKISG